jgi:hypothetical protein
MRTILRAVLYLTLTAGSAYAGAGPSLFPDPALDQNRNGAIEPEERLALHRAVPQFILITVNEAGSESGLRWLEQQLQPAGAAGHVTYFAAAGYGLALPPAPRAALLGAWHRAAQQGSEIALGGLFLSCQKAAQEYTQGFYLLSRMLGERLGPGGFLGWRRLCDAEGADGDALPPLPPLPKSLQGRFRRYDASLRQPHPLTDGAPGWPDSGVDFVWPHAAADGTFAVPLPDWRLYRDGRSASCPSLDIALTQGVPPVGSRMRTDGGGPIPACALPLSQPRLLLTQLLANLRAHLAGNHAPFHIGLSAHLFAPGRVMERQFLQDLLAEVALLGRSGHNLRFVSISELLVWLTDRPGAGGALSTKATATSSLR